MTKIDKAFAKAFGQANQQRKESAPLLRGPHVPLARPAVPAAAPAPEPPKVEAAPPAPVSEPVVFEPIEPVLQTPAPKAKEEIKPKEEIKAKEEPKARPAPAVEAAVTPAPLSIPRPRASTVPTESELAALVARTPVASPSAAVAGPDSKLTLAPKTVIDCFDWSPTEIAICERASDELARLAEHVAPRTAAGLKLLLLTSWARGEGRTSLLCCLGRELARQGLRVALVDGDFARPSMAARLGLTPKHSWTDVLTGDVSLADVAVESTGDSLVVLPLREASPGSVARFPSGPRLRLVLGLLRRDYDLVLIDGGPLSDGNDPPAGWPQIDAAILVHGPKTLPEDLLKAERQLEAAGVEVLGIAENLQ